MQKRFELKEKFKNILRFEKNENLQNQTKMTFRERMDFYQNRIVNIESEIKEHTKAISKLYEEFGILRQRLDDCQEAEKERNTTNRDTKGDWKWILSIVLSFVAMLIGWLK